MRKPRVKWFLFVLALLAVVIGIPVIINESYKANSGYMTMWGAADALAYYGTILGALVAVATVVVTILFTYKQIQRDSYLRRENEKWFDVESVFSNALNTINLKFGEILSPSDRFSLFKFSLLLRKETDKVNYNKVSNYLALLSGRLSKKEDKRNG